MKFDPNPQAALKPAKKVKSHGPDVELPSERLAVQQTIDLPPIPVSLELSLTTWRSGYLPRQLNMARIHTTRITLEQAVALKFLTASLSQQGALLKNNRYVENSADAIRYVLERVADHIPPEVHQLLIP